MCGVNGFNFEDKGLIRAMNKAIAHRGPDDSGIYTDKGISLGNRRLSIIDLSKRGKQPMQNKNLHIVYNGEIYNFKEIRTKLEKKGHRFKSNTDTEVVLHAYEQYGKRCVGLFNGMFAFAIWDSKKKELFLARDRIGIKPLYYYFKDKLIFSSEIKAILKHNIKKEVNKNALNDFLAFKYIPGPETILKNIYKLQPGHILTYKKGKIKIEEYWDLNFKPEKKSEAFYRKAILGLLKDSVKKRLMADVPLGVFLSGGLDSSAITALMSKFAPVKTFSVGFETDDKKYDELKYARLVSRTFNTEHHESIVGFKDIRRLLPEITYYLDEPMSDYAAIPTYIISKVARKKVKVALAGDGGDELFVGYRQYIYNQFAPYYGALPKIIKTHLLPKFISTFLPRTSKVKKAIDTFAMSSDIKRNANWTTVFDENERKKLFLGNPKSKILSQYKRKIKDFDNLSKILYWDIKTWLVEDLLMKMDKMSMMTSLEARVPLLDHRLIELMSKIPSSMKLSGFKTKYLMKKIIKPILPKEILARKKHGFTLPIEHWFRYELKNYTEDVLADRELNAYLNKNYVNKILKLHQQGKENYSFQICSLLSFGIWHKIYMQGVNFNKIK